jgi:leucyl aminopeptidase (aminopeptidase T)
MAIRLIGGVNYQELVERGKQLVDLLRESQGCRMEAGEDAVLTMSVAGCPPVLRDGILEGPGDLDFMPGAQLSLVPVEETINGHIVVDGSVYPLVGLVDTPLRLTYERGKLVAVEGGPAGKQWWEWLARFNDPKMFCMAHISLGMNPAARLTGNILEDERVAGCFVIGMGS